MFTTPGVGDVEIRLDRGERIPLTELNNEIVSVAGGRPAQLVEFGIREPHFVFVFFLRRFESHGNCSNKLALMAAYRTEIRVWKNQIAGWDDDLY